MDTRFETFDICSDLSGQHMQEGVIWLMQLQGDVVNKNSLSTQMFTSAIESSKSRSLA